MTRKYAATVIAVCVAGLAVWLLVPLPSGPYAIRHDPALLERKRLFMDENARARPGDRPNILLIMADDLGMADVSCYGLGNMETPNIDRLATQGTAFRHAYVTSPVCSPSRAAILTGQYQQRFGFQFQMHDRYLRNRLEYYGFKYFVNSYPWRPKWTSTVPDRDAVHKQGIPPWVVTLPELLQKSGYATGIVGKWHLGWSEGQKPSEMGFGYQYGFYASHSLYAPEGTKGIIGQKIKADWTDKYIWSGQRKGPHAIFRNGIEIEEKTYLTEKFTDEAIGFMQQYEDTPFFLFLSYNAPHTPLQAPAAYVERFSHIQDPVHRIYRAMVSSLDDGIGRVLDFLDSSGLSNNTLVIFLSDNGGAEYTRTTDNGPYKGGKITDLEGGIKVPMIMQWNKVLPSGTWYEKPVISLDIFATIATAARLSTPPWQSIDGVNLVPRVLGEDTLPPHKHMYWQRGFSKAIRSESWKLLINGEANDTVLFHLASDPYERIDVHRVHKQVASDLGKTHRSWAAELPPPSWPSMIYYHYKDDDRDYYFDQ
jgi:arylsulfatase A-like enzyme